MVSAVLQSLQYLQSGRRYLETPRLNLAAPRHVGNLLNATSATTSPRLKSAAPAYALCYACSAVRAPESNATPFWKSVRHPAQGPVRSQFVAGQGLHIPEARCASSQEIWGSQASHKPERCVRFLDHVKGYMRLRVRPCDSDHVHCSLSTHTSSVFPIELNPLACRKAYPLKGRHQSQQNRRAPAMAAQSFPTSWPAADAALQKGCKSLCKQLASTSEAVSSWDGVRLLQDCVQWRAGQPTVDEFVLAALFDLWIPVALTFFLGLFCSPVVPAGLYKGR